MTQFYLASSNTHKAAELQSLARASQVRVEILSARELGGMPPIDEDTGTFIGNARKKALTLHSHVPAGTWALADDSGVCVDALNDEPGMESAYYAGPQADATANLMKLVTVMRDVPGDQRGAQFRCVLVAIKPAGDEHVFSKEYQKHLLFTPENQTDFDYDPLFIPDGYDQNYTELKNDVKNRISHRTQA